MRSQIQFKIRKGKRSYAFTQEVDSPERGQRLYEDLRSLPDIIHVSFVRDLDFKEEEE